MMNYMQGPHLRSRLGNAVIDTNENGKFAIFPAKGEPYYLLATHEEGFAIVRSDEFEANRMIRMQPWAHVRGSMLPDKRFDDWVAGHGCFAFRCARTSDASLRM